MGYRSYKNPLNEAPLRTVTGRGNDPRSRVAKIKKHAPVQAESGPAEALTCLYHRHGPRISLRRQADGQHSINLL